MDLYIRSQDRLILEKNETLQLCQNPDGTWFFNSGLVLGKYSSKERALEVLDEIQNILKQEEMLHINKSLLNDLDDIEEPKYILKPVYQPRVYEMPQD